MFEIEFKIKKNVFLKISKNLCAIIFSIVDPFWSIPEFYQDVFPKPVLVQKMIEPILSQLTGSFV